MEDDSEKPIHEIDTYQDGSQGRLWSMVEQAQSYALRRRDVRRWIDTGLRVLVAAPPSSLSKYDVELVPHLLSSGVPYVAVSYCWQSEDETMDEDMTRPVRVLQNGKVREARARPDVVRRALRYAHSVGVERVWIDQDCIEQEDPVDKEAAIQSMDLVYENAYLTLGLVGRCVCDEADVQALKKLMEMSFAKPEERDLTDDSILPLVTRLAHNMWFTRTWTLQEYICADTIVLLAAWEHDLAETQWESSTQQINHIEGVLADAPLVRVKSNIGDSQKTYGEWSISERLWNETMRWLIAFVDAIAGENDESESEGADSEDIADSPESDDEKDDTSHAESEGYAGMLEVEDILRIVREDQARNDRLQAKNKLTVPFGSSYDSDLSFDLDAVTACNSLGTRNNHRTADRIAIVANLCNSKWGISVDQVEKEDLGLVSCLLAQALLNGDISFLLRSSRLYNEGNPPPLSGWRLPGDKPFRHWTLNGPTTYGNVNPALIQDGTLLVDGYLWKIIRYDAFDPLKPEIKRLLDTLQLEDDLVLHGVLDETSMEIRRECLRLILLRLSALEHRLIFETIAILNSIIRRTGPKSTSAAAAKLSESLSASPTRFPPEFALLGHENSATFQLDELCRKVALGLPVYCAVPADGSDSAPEPRALIASTSPVPRAEHIFVTAHHARANEASWARACWGVRVAEKGVSVGRALQRLQKLDIQSRDLVADKRLEVVEYLFAEFTPELPFEDLRMYFLD